LALLEQYHAGGRPAVRRELFRRLQPDLSLPGAVHTHEALLDLSREGRIVTTNFDRLFEEVADPGLPRAIAPLLPVPKTRWRGLVYLHGRLPVDEEDNTPLDDLVLSSGDFGLAYLTERWAARFVSELLRNHTVTSTLTSA
jgi:hypothetical protein